MRYMVIGKRPAILLALLSLCLLAALTRGLQGAVRSAAAEQKYPIYSVETVEKKVALGINCAWDDQDIPMLLEILGHYGIKATFFVVGDWCDKYPESLRRIYEAGHEIGSHSDTHADMTKLDRDGMVREIRRSAEKIQAITGRSPDLLRPPSGAYNRAVVETILAEGFYPIQWDCEAMNMKT